MISWPAAARLGGRRRGIAAEGAGFRGASVSWRSQRRARALARACEAGVPAAAACQHSGDRYSAVARAGGRSASARPRRTAGRFRFTSPKAAPRTSCTSSTSLEAEHARINGQTAEAMSKYDQAIVLARRDDFPCIWRRWRRSLIARSSIWRPDASIGALYPKRCARCLLPWGGPRPGGILEQKIFVAAPWARCVVHRGRPPLRDDEYDSDHRYPERRSLDIHTFTIRAAQALGR